MRLFTRLKYDIFNSHLAEFFLRSFGFDDKVSGFSGAKWGVTCHQMSWHVTEMSGVNQITDRRHPDQASQLHPPEIPWVILPKEFYLFII